MTKMMIVLVGSLALLLSSGAVVRAQVSIDVTKITCEQFILYKVTDPRYIALWLSGYYHAKQNNSVIDPQELTEQIDKVRQYCRTNLGTPVIQAVEAIVTAGK
jgi:acid stress chaperone HdeB